MKRWLAVTLLVACANDDEQGESADSSSDDSSIPDGGPCGIAGGPLVEDELHTPQIGSDAEGRPAVLVELHEAGTCSFEPAAAVALVAFDVATDTITVGTAAVAIDPPADYHDERYWWDALGVDAELVRTETSVTVIFHHGSAAPMVVCTPEQDSVACTP
jgi:hypothetical protein